MDTSPEYINMCRKATELQKDHVWEDGDFAVVHDNVLTVIGDDTITYISKDLYQYSVKSEIKTLTPLTPCVWLPRIDQLVELSGVHWKLFNELSNDRHLELFFQGLKGTVKYTGTFETIGIEVCMWMAYKKKWNGDDWIEL